MDGFLNEIDASLLIFIFRFDVVGRQLPGAGTSGLLQLGHRSRRIAESVADAMIFNIIGRVLARPAKRSPALPP